MAVAPRASPSPRRRQPASNSRRRDIFGEIGHDCDPRWPKAANARPNAHRGKHRDPPDGWCRPTRRDRLVYKHRKRHRMWPAPPRSEPRSLLRPQGAHRLPQRLEIVDATDIFCWFIVIIFFFRRFYWDSPLSVSRACVVVGALVRRFADCQRTGSWNDTKQTRRWPNGFFKNIYLHLIHSENLPAPPHKPRFVHNC